MAIDINEVKHIADLAKLSFSEDELQRMAKELDSIVRYMEKLKALDVSHVESTTHVTDLHNVFREDKTSSPMPVQEALRNAPARKLDYFSVPKVL